MKNKYRTISLILLSFIMIIPVLVSGVQYVNDSAGYIKGMAVRSGIYPLFLCLTRVLSGSFLAGESYLYIVVLLQSALAIYAIYQLAETLIGTAGKKSVLHRCIFYFCLMMPWFTYLALEKVWISCAIFSEGITYSLYYLSVCLLIRYLNDATLQNLAAVFIPTALSVLARKQSFIFLAVILLICLIKERKNIRRTAFAVLLSLITLLAAILVDNLYRQIFPSEPDITNYDQNLLANFVYFGTEDDRKFMDEDETIVFEYTLGALTDGGYTYKQQSGQYSGLELTYRRSKNYDNASFRMISQTKLRDIAAGFAAKYDITYSEAIGYTKKLFRSVEFKTALAHKIQFIYMYLSRVTEALIRTVFIDLKWVRMIGLIALGLWCVWMRAFREKKALLLSSLGIGLSMLANSICVAAVIFPTYRYMMYNMGLFYLIMWLYACEFAERIKLRFSLQA